MAEVCAFFPIVRTRGNLTFYMMDGKNYVRKKSRLTAKRVKTSKQFARTRYYAGLMGEASKIGSALFRALPVKWRQSWMYRTFTGEAMQLLKAGKTAAEAKQVLWTMYVQEVNKKATGNLTAATAPSPAEPRRQYIKRNKAYWTGKTIKAIKRKQQKVALQHNARLMARASVIASGIYRSLPAHQRHYSLYRALTGLLIKTIHSPQSRFHDSSLCKAYEITVTMHAKTVSHETIDDHSNGRYYTGLLHEKHQRYVRA